MTLVGRQERALSVCEDADAVVQDGQSSDVRNCIAKRKKVGPVDQATTEAAELRSVITRDSDGAVTAPKW